MKKNLLTTTIAFILSGTAVAETQQNTTALPAIHVYSAYATPVNQDKTASSVTVLTEKDFAERNATYVSDVLKTVPGVAITSFGGRGTLANVHLRGAEADQTVFIIDGVKVKPVTNDAFNFGGLSLSNIERIEVLRGEQSALWGSDAMGGVIYITTKSGLYKDKPFNVDFDLGTGSHGTYDGSVTISGYKNGFYYALHGDSHNTRGISALSKNGFSYISETGWRKTATDAVENDEFHRDNISLKVGYDDNNKGIEVLAGHSSQTVHYDGSLKGETIHDDYTRTRETLLKLSGYFGNDQDLLKHKVNLTHVKTDNKTIEFNTWIFPAAIEKSENKAKKLNASYQLDINFDRDGYVTQGMSLLGEYQKSKYFASEYANNKKEVTDKSIAMEYRLFTEDDHALTLSGRYIDNSFYGDALTARISGAYRLSPNFRAHASFGTATQTPTIAEYFGYAPWTLANPELKKEKSKGGDLGLLIETTDKKHSLDVIYFARNVKDLIVPEYNPVVDKSKNINVSGISKIRGVEVIYNGKLFDNLTAFANYTYTRAKDAKHLELVRRPKHTANAGLSYQITEQLGSSVSISYVGKRIDLGRYKMPSYTLANLGVNYQINKHLNVYAHLNNVFNKKYENIVGYGQDGRNVYVGLKGSF